MYVDSLKKLKVLAFRLMFSFYDTRSFTADLLDRPLDELQSKGTVGLLALTPAVFSS